MVLHGNPPWNFPPGKFPYKRLLTAALFTRSPTGVQSTLHQFLQGNLPIMSYLSCLSYSQTKRSIGTLWLSNLIRMVSFFQRIKSLRKNRDMGPTFSLFLKNEVSMEGPNREGPTIQSLNHLNLLTREDRNAYQPEKNQEFRAIASDLRFSFGAQMAEI